MTPEEQEARSTVHARDRFSVRQLSTGRFAIYSYTYSLIAILDNLWQVILLPELSHERLAARQAAEQAEAVRQTLLSRVNLNQLEIEI